MEVLGLHAHEAENPHGHRYRVRCFRRAGGLETTSNPSAEWSWFPGYRWESQACAGCGALAGWRFLREDDAFYALIAEGC